MLSTQRNESMNGALKKKIKHYKRTNVIRIISIVSEMIDSQYQKVFLQFFLFIIFQNLKTQLKINNFSFEKRDLTLEAMVYEICSPFIAKKIILEIYRAKEGQYLIQEKTPQTFEVVFKNNKDQQTKQRIVNTDLMTCTYLKKNYFAFLVHIFLQFCFKTIRTFVYYFLL